MTYVNLARVPSASACHDTMRSVSQAIVEQLSKIDSSKNRSSSAVLSPGSLGRIGRGFRGAPISSSRDDPMPSEGFPAPLPPTTLPYELSLLDYLFINPMAQHNKASDYTNGKKCAKGKGTGKPNGISISELGGNSHGGLNGSGDGGPTIGFPPGAFQSTFTSPGNNGIGPYGLAAVGLSHLNGNGQISGGGFSGGIDNLSNTPIETNGNGHGHASTSNGTDMEGLSGSGSGLGGMNPHGLSGLYSQVPEGGLGGGVGGSGNTPSASGGGTSGGSHLASGGGSQSAATAAGGDPNFDIFSFLMDEEGGIGGTGTWDALDVPPDFSLWS